MKKYFIVSDTHGFATILKNTLINNGFDYNNPDHILILCGDLFDRGSEAVDIYEFVKNLGDRFIYVRGNHEDLLKECLSEIESGYRVSSHHISNKTADTIEQFLSHFYGSDWDALRLKYIEAYVKSNYEDKSELLKFYHPIHNLVDWVDEKSINYYEIGKYIFVHGWIPKTPEDNMLYRWNGVAREGGRYNANWREASEFDWNEARWLNGMEEWKWYGVREPNKTIVCGHYHCSYGHSYIEQKYKEFPPKSKKGWEKSFKPFIGEGIIAIDACTAYSGLINVLVIDEESVY